MRVKHGTNLVERKKMCCNDDIDGSSRSEEVCYIYMFMFDAISLATKKKNKNNDTIENVQHIFRRWPTTVCSTNDDWD